VGSWVVAHSSKTIQGNKTKINNAKQKQKEDYDWAGSSALTLFWQLQTQ
jgi:hypothetical protein